MGEGTTLTAEEIILGLNSEQPLLNSELVELSDLSSVEVNLLSKIWGGIELKRRRDIIHRLVDLSEENYEYNFDSIFKQSLKDPDAEIRCASIEGLWENEAASLITPIIHLLETDNSENVQAASARALGKFSLLAEHGRFRPCYSIRMLEALLAIFNDQNRNVEVRRRALEAVASINQPEVKTAISNAYNSGNERLLVSSICAMGKNMDPAWMPTLLDELSNADEEIRYESAVACGEMEDQAAVPQLIELVEDSDSEIPLAAILALGKIGGPRAKTCLKKLTKDSNIAIRDAAKEAIEELEAKEGLAEAPTFHENGLN